MNSHLRHANHRQRRGRTTPPRWAAVLAAAALGVVALSTGVTSAFWTDTSTATTGVITAGIMDLQLKTTAPVGAVGPGTAYSATDIAVANITPSESRSYPVTVKNVGDANFTYSATVTRSTTRAWGFADGSVTVQFFTGVPDSSDVTYPIQQTCTGTAVTTAQAVSAANSVVVTTQAVPAGAERALCAVVAMTAAAPNTDQGKSGALRFDFAATQTTS
ncbi:hypothetical protein C5C03_00135 [Clavibacter michiganensis]|uniref:SipW-dependent-type signal peptide-containing protein n=1 Tax=Clavibacter michiganensis TaxID=28447 RepID=UPI000CE93339|nr:SipW-dependent-type signal peptide-containing protein [Clavibacter michiganensis]PPF91272.1 hypothetical protein C5C03_00135 [Clavibacter michiganensis]PPF99314.1 hypothetical protein C5C05_01940 [Clavibacter michiganensis]